MTDRPAPPRSDVSLAQAGSSSVGREDQRPRSRVVLAHESCLTRRGPRRALRTLLFEEPHLLLSHPCRAFQTTGENLTLDPPLHPILSPCPRHAQCVRSTANNPHHHHQIPSHPLRRARRRARRARSAARQRRRRARGRRAAPRRFSPPHEGAAAIPTHTGGAPPPARPRERRRRRRHAARKGRSGGRSRRH